MVECRDRHGAWIAALCVLALSLAGCSKDAGEGPSAAAEPAAEPAAGPGAGGEAPAKLVDPGVKPAEPAVAAAKPTTPPRAKPAAAAAGDAAKAPTDVAAARGARPRQDGAPPVQPTVPDDEKIAVFYTSGIIGELDDCGCRRNPMGGLARRVAYIEEHRKDYKDAIVLDAGGLLSQSPRGQVERPGEVEARAEVFFAAMKANGLAAFNVGVHDLALKPDALNKLSERHGVPLVSSNLIDATSGKPVFPTHHLVEAGGVKIGILGLVAASSAYNTVIEQAGLKARDPLVAARETAAKLREQGAELIIALSQLQKDELAAFEQGAATGVHVVLGSLGMEYTAQLQRFGKTWHGDIPAKGKYLGRLLVQPRKDRTTWEPADQVRALYTLKATTEAFIQRVEGQVATQQRTVDAYKPDEPKRRNAEAVLKSLQRQLTQQKARLASLQLDIDAGPKGNEEASHLWYSLEGLPTKLGEHQGVLAKVNKLRERFPKVGGHH